MPRPGDCYEVAFHFMIENPLGQHSTLVHGKITNKKTKRWIDHAWVEIRGGLIYDGTFSDGFFKKEEYYELTRAKPERKYSERDAIRHAVRSKHYGAWHK